MAQVKKISVATVFGAVDRKQIIESAGKPVPIMRVLGQAVGVKSGTSSYGDWNCLVGQFKAINLQKPEITLEAAQCFLPDVALIPLQVALSGNDARGVQFAIDIFANLSNNTKPGGSLYEYSFENILAPSDTDPIAAMERKIEEQMRALAAPDADKETGEIAASESAPADTPALAPAPATSGKKGK